MNELVWRLNFPIFHLENKQTRCVRLFVSPLQCYKYSGAKRVTETLRTPVAHSRLGTVKIFHAFLTRHVAVIQIAHFRSWNLSPIVFQLIVSLHYVSRAPLMLFTCLQNIFTCFTTYQLFNLDFK